MSASRRIVSVTPLAVEADSRTYKQAASFARLGYRSIVVEGRPSSLPREALPFELRGFPGSPASAAIAGAAPEPGARPSPLRNLLSRTPGVRGVLLGLYGVGAWLRDRLRETQAGRRGLPSAELYVLHEFSLFGAVRAAARRSGAPIVYDAHDLYWALASEQRGAPGYLRSVALLRRLLERLCVREAAACMTVGPRLAELEQQRFRKPFAVVRNTHDARLDRTSPDSIRARTGIPDGAVLVVVVGNAKPSLAIREMLEAMRTMPVGVHLAFVGRRYERFAETIESLGLGQSVTLAGAVPPTHIASFLRDADVAANVYVPSSINAANALPNGFFQSIAAGLPLLYPRLPELQRIAERYELGIPVDPRDPVDLAARMQEFVGDSELRSRCRRGSAEAARALSWEAEERKLRQILNSVLVKSPELV